MSHLINFAAGAAQSIGSARRSDRRVHRLGSLPKSRRYRFYYVMIGVRPASDSHYREAWSEKLPDVRIHKLMNRFLANVARSLIVRLL